MARRVSILVADPGFQDFSSIQSAWKQQGRDANLIVFQTGDQVLSYLMRMVSERNEPPAAVIIDCDLPGVSAEWLHKYIVSEQIFRTCIVLFVKRSDGSAIGVPPEMLSDRPVTIDQWALLLKGVLSILDRRFLDSPRTQVRSSRLASSGPSGSSGGGRSTEAQAPDRATPGP